MDCPDFRKNLTVFYKNMIPADRKREMERHLESCRDCQRLHNGFLMAEKVIQHEREVQPIPFSGTRVLQRVEDRLTKPSVPAAWHLRQAVISMVIVAAVIFGTTIGLTGAYLYSSGIREQTLLEELRTDLYIYDFTEAQHDYFVND
jgi:hypothetical protein